MQENKNNIHQVQQCISDNNDPNDSLNSSTNNRCTLCINFIYNNISCRLIIKISIILLCCSIIMTGGILLYRNRLLMNRSIPLIDITEFLRVDIPSLSAIDQSTYRSYYFYKQLFQAIRNNNTVKLTKSYEVMTFWELFDLFKVLKTIQYSKQYNVKQKVDKIVLNNSHQENQTLLKPYNYTQYLGEVVDQYSCASCYVFPVTATIEYQYAKKLNRTVKLSEQQLIDCSKLDPQANGCQDGNMTHAFQYIVENGILLNQHYPYRSAGGSSYQCDRIVIQNHEKIKIQSYKKINKGDCQQIQAQLAEGNVIAAMINSDKLTNYESGAFIDCKRNDLNHAVTIVGQTYNREWIVRNSWGSNFASHGYFLIGRGNNCGICNNAIVPILQKKK